MSRLGPQMKAWRAAAPAGCCPACRRQLPGSGRRPRVTCGRRRCQQKYQRVYALDLLPATSLQRVRRVEARADTPGRCWVLLECGHRLDMVRSQAARGIGRRHCPECPKVKRKA